MAGQITTVPTDGKSIIKGQPFSVVVLITDEPHINVNSTKVSVVSHSPGVKLIKTFPGAIVKGRFSQQLIFQADESGGEQKIQFTANTTGNPKHEVTYHAVDNPDLEPNTCILRGSAAYLYDSKPVNFTGQPPDANNPFVSASINPMVKHGGPISNYDIPLRTTAPLRIFTAEDMNEIQPYDIDLDKQFYYYLIQKTSNAAVNLKIYATQGVSKFVELDTIFNYEGYNQRQVIFITTVPTNVSDDLEPPNIEETFLSSTLTRPDQLDDFTFMVPSYKGAKIGDFIIGFVTDDRKDTFKKELFVGQLTVEESGYYRFKAAYSDMYSGDNHISYVTLNQTGTPVRSKLNYINYDNDGINGPSPNDKHRTLVAPKVYDQYNQFIGIYDPVNINSIGTKGLEVRLPSDPNNPNHTIAPGDMITIKAYISHYVDIFPEKARPLPIMVVKNQPVKSTEITNGYYKVTITPDKLMGYDSADGYDVAVLTIDYSRLAQNQKSKIFTRSFGTVAPGEGGDSVE
ncbi:hypothetical protein BDD26_2551 [Xenorhabdus cabanillasii]|uniref:Uncharacterized protein n=1 Tax=Xenorhabdus cabanillasii TaxID=351673 RepID=A0A3D9UM71_9GAMM|nr:hypothetical protein [Xenorhabdus cabanillasii]REF27735.1 hypothetical protein BDD26_2551 [Xenorhabdus cabanillasii]